MQTILFATSNANKLAEVRLYLEGKDYQIIGLKDLDIHHDIPETGNTLEANASIKSEYLARLYPDYHIISEDTGLEVDALDGAPGVHTARYASEDKDAKQNMAKLLSELDGKKNRSAQFRAVISYIYSGVEKQYEGIVRGSIAESPKGDGGFGYDPIFIPDGYDETFASLGTDIKKTMSHRSRAVQQWIDDLN